MKLQIVRVVTNATKVEVIFYDIVVEFLLLTVVAKETIYQYVRNPYLRVNPTYDVPFRADLDTYRAGSSRQIF
jgi:hypothetical protein